MAGPPLGRLDVIADLGPHRHGHRAKGSWPPTTCSMQRTGAVDGAGDDLVQPVLAMRPKAILPILRDLPTNVAKMARGYVSSGSNPRWRLTRPKPMRAQAMGRTVGRCASTSGMPRAVAPLMQTTWDLAFPAHMRNAPAIGDRLRGYDDVPDNEVLVPPGHGLGLTGFNHPNTAP
ncbi:MAG: hypothetical protein IPF64_17595 [Flavobacteriales bacterium]|nr:hypothetical protein [Flavobacteriales bacterium]